MHDSRLEDQLRRVLRTEGDSLRMTITAGELEQHRAIRQRKRSGRRLTLVAAGVAAVALGAMVAMTNGWLQVPGIGIDPAPTSSTHVSPPPTIDPTTTPETPGPRPARQLGGPDDAVVARSIIDPTSDVQTIEVQLVPKVGDASVIATLSGLIGANPSPQTSSRVSSAGFLAVPLVDWTDEAGFVGVAIYDLLQPTRDPHILAGIGSFGMAWGPDGRLALYDPDVITLVEPYGGGRSAVPVPADVVVATTQQDVIWSNAGDGLLALRQDGAASTWGVLGLDGTFLEGPTQVMAPTGTERLLDRSGRQLMVDCDAVNDGTATGCSLLAETPTGPSEAWYRDPSGVSRVADFRWDAAGQGVWLLLDLRTHGRTLDLVVRTGGPETYTDVATLSDIEIRATTNPRLVGISPDDGRLAIALDEGLILLVDRSTGRSYATGGRFAGWADTGEAMYPRTSP